MLGVRSRSQDHLISTLAGLWHPQSLSGWWVTGSTWINLFILKKYSQHLQSAELYAIDTKWTRRTSEYWDCLNRHARTIKCHVRHIQKMMQRGWYLWIGTQAETSVCSPRNAGPSVMGISYCCNRGSIISWFLLDILWTLIMCLEPSGHMSSLLNNKHFHHLHGISYTLDS